MGARPARRRRPHDLLPRRSRPARPGRPRGAPQPAPGAPAGLARAGQARAHRPARGARRRSAARPARAPRPRGRRPRRRPPAGTATGCARRWPTTAPPPRSATPSWASSTPDARDRRTRRPAPVVLGLRRDGCRAGVLGGSRASRLDRAALHPARGRRLRAGRRVRGGALARHQPPAAARRPRPAHGRPVASAGARRRRAQHGHDGGQHDRRAAPGLPARAVRRRRAGRPARRRRRGAAAGRGGGARRAARRRRPRPGRGGPAGRRARARRRPGRGGRRRRTGRARCHLVDDRSAGGPRRVAARPAGRCTARAGVGAGDRPGAGRRRSRRPDHRAGCRGARPGHRGADGRAAAARLRPRRRAPRRRGPVLDHHPLARPSPSTTPGAPCAPR